ncbi:MAG: PAS domain S-box protein [Chloroflexi bacterium]|nr:PAS domain S-box protein [Chloroflexota bacterium]
MTKNDEFTRRVHRAEQHVERLSQQIDALDSKSSERRMLAEALLELTGALDDLRTADDQLEEQHQTLVVTREALEQERERFRHLFDYAPDGQIITDIRGRILRVNSAASLLMEVDPRFLVNKPLAVYIDPEHKPLFWKMLRNLQSRTISEAGESVIESRTGISIEVMIQAVRSEAHDADEIHWHFQNISEQRHQEQVERDQYFRTTFENTTVGIAHIGSRGEWIRANQHLCDLFACTHDELMRLTFRDFTHPDQLSAAEETHRQLVTGEKDSVVVEQRYLRRDKGVFWALVSYTAVRSAQGLYLYTIAVINDITDRLTIEAIEREQRAIAEVLRDTALLLTRTLNLPTIIDTIRESIGRLVPHDFAVVLLTDGERASVMEPNEAPTPLAQDGNGMVRTLSWRIADIPVLQSMFETQYPIVVPQWQDDSDMTTALDLKSMRSFVGAPIVVRSDVLGFVLLYCRQVGFFGEQHAQLLKVFASQAASAVQNARAYEQAQTLAVIGERQRLARELHDAVSQTLFSASIVAETLPRLWKSIPTRLKNSSASCKC